MQLANINRRARSRRACGSAQATFNPLSYLQRRAPKVVRTKTLFAEQSLFVTYQQLDRYSSYSFIIMDSVNVKALKVNKSPITDHDIELFKDNKETRRWARSPFKVDTDINRRVVLYDGDLELLQADALVNPTNENLTQMSLVNKLAGPELEVYMKKNIKVCATGDVKVSPGFKSNFKHIIHAVPPKYQPKYKTAAETALFHTYFRILETLIEKKIRTVVMPTLTTSKCNLPIEENFHMQLRIIRRILEKKKNEFDRIVVHVENGEESLIPFLCYFPSNQLDEEVACYRLTSAIGGSNGEPVIPEREIRIKWPLATLQAIHRN